MELETSWREGLDNYKENIVLFDAETNTRQHHHILHDVPTQDNRSYLEIVQDMLQNVDKVDVLFSGGVDSELVLRTVLELGINVNVVTLKLLVNGCVGNTHDLYHSEKYCKENNIKQNFMELEVVDFIRYQKKHLEYLEPYRINEPHVAGHFYMIDNCDNFPIMAGEYTWPWVVSPLLSPHRLAYVCYNKFMEDKKIRGIGNFLNHSLELNMHLIKKHISMYDETTDVGPMKANLYSTLGLGSFEHRLRSYGWERFTTRTFNINKEKDRLVERFGEIPSTIFWEEKIKSLLQGDVNSNARYS